MHPFFAPLQEQELALLLITLTVGGSEQISLFAHLPPPQRAAVEQKAGALLAIAADKRIPLMVRELKDAWLRHGRRGVERMDPSWLVHGLRGEAPRTIAVILLALPAPVVRSVLRRLPPKVREALPPKAEIRRIHPALSDGVRMMFESRFVPMPERGADPFRLTDIIHLERPELFWLTRDLGLTELGQAFVSVGKMALLELCRRLPREHADELIYAVKTASPVDLPETKSAQRFLSRVVVNFENTEELLQKAGLWRLAKACMAEPDSFIRTLLQRLPRRAAHHLEGYRQKAQEFAEISPEVGARLQDGVLVRVVLLSRNGTIGAAWQQAPMGYHDPQAAAEAAAVATAPNAMPAPQKHDMLAEPSAPDGLESLPKAPKA